VLSQSERDAKLKECESWARWRPLQPQTVLALALHDEGYSSGGIEIRAHGRRKYQALVIATCETQWVKPTDIIVFDLGKGEQMHTLHGETFWWMQERSIDGVDDDFFQPPKQTAGGLWVP
jgi:hypothetical protein